MRQNNVASWGSSMPAVSRARGRFAALLAATMASLWLAACGNGGDAAAESSGAAPSGTVSAAAPGVAEASAASGTRHALAATSGPFKPSLWASHTAAREISIPFGQSLILQARTAPEGSSAKRYELLDGGQVVPSGLPVTSKQTYWTGPEGVHMLTLRATDNAGTVATSAPLKVTITPRPAGALPPPKLSLCVADARLPEPEAGVRRLVATFTPGSTAAGSAIDRVEFYSALDGYLGGVSQAPYSMAWMNDGSNTAALSARVIDRSGLEAIAVADAAACANAGTVPPATGLPPAEFSAWLTITQPDSSNAPLGPGQTLTLAAHVDSVRGGVLERVEFYAWSKDPAGEREGLKFIGSANKAPYTVVWTNPPVGTQALVARAVSTTGRGTSRTAGFIFNNYSSSVFGWHWFAGEGFHAWVGAPAAGASLTWLSPRVNTVMELGRGLRLRVQALGPDGQHNSAPTVRLRANGQEIARQLGVDQAGPAWFPTATGTYVLTAAVTVPGTTREVVSEPLSVWVVAPGATSPTTQAQWAPRVDVVTPLEGAEVVQSTTPYAVKMAWKDLDGTVELLNFTSNGGVAGTYNWPTGGETVQTPVPSQLPGTVITLAVEAKDDWDTITVLRDRHWTIVSAAANQPPKARLLVPSAPTSVPVKSRFTLQAEASDADGRVVKLEFLDNGRVMSTLTAAPWTLSGTATWVGPHRLQVRATDDRGAVTTSDTVTVQVLATP